MDRPVRSIRIVSEYFHNVDLTASRPLSVEILICRHHPECGKEALPFRNFHSCFKQSVFEIMFILCIYTSGSVGHTAVFIHSLYRFQHKASIFNIDIFR